MFFIRPHANDKDVFELITLTKRKTVSVWAIILKDFLFDADVERAQEISLALKEGEEFKCELTIKENS